MYTITGDAKVANNTLTLTGAGKAASATTSNFSLSELQWEKALLWVYSNVPGVTADMNGISMRRIDQSFAYLPNYADSVFEQLFVVERPKSGLGIQITLNLDCGQNNSISVYDFYTFFL